MKKHKVRKFHQAPSVRDLSDRWQKTLPPAEFVRRMDIILNGGKKRRQAEEVLREITDRGTKSELGWQTACCLLRNIGKLTSGTASSLAQLTNMSGCPAQT